METIRSGIRTLLDGVIGIGGVVWDHRRIIDDPESFLGVYVRAGTTINCWQFYNSDIVEVGVGLGGIETRTFTWVVEGWYTFTDHAALASSSEFAFDDLVERISNAFRGQYRIGGVTNEAYPMESISKEVIELFGVRCHHAIMKSTISKEGL